MKITIKIKDIQIRLILLKTMKIRFYSYKLLMKVKLSYTEYSISMCSLFL